MKPLSLRVRIACLTAALTGIVMLLAGAAAWMVISHQKTAAIDTRIRSLGSRLPGWMFQHGDHRRLEENLGFIIGETVAPNLALLLISPEGGEIYRSEHWPAEWHPAEFKQPLKPSVGAVSPEPSGRGMGMARGGRRSGLGLGGGRGQGLHFDRIPEFSSRHFAGTSWRIGRMGNDELTLVIALNTAEADRELQQLARGFVVTLPIALVLTGAAGWLVATRALRPLRIISASVAQINSRKLSQRIPLVDSDPEISQLITMLNGMMDRLETSFHQATRFSADASHELKTPLAILQGELEAALAKAPHDGAQPQVYASLLEETRRLGVIIRSLLLLTRADAGQLALSSQLVDLSELAEEWVEDLETLAATAELSVTHAVTAGLKVSADPSLLTTAVRNLITNAVRYNRLNGHVHLTVRADGTHAVIEVDNTGPSIPADEQNLLFNRFHRGSLARRDHRDGTGLGLSLAHEIFAAHGGSVELSHSSAEQTRFTARIPCV